MSLSPRRGLLSRWVVTMAFYEAKCPGRGMASNFRLGGHSPASDSSSGTVILSAAKDLRLFFVTFHGGLRLPFITVAAGVWSPNRT